MIPYGPIIAAFIATALANGRIGVASLLKDMIHWRVGIRWYAFAFLLPLGVTLAAIYLNTLFGAPATTSADLAGWYILIPAFVTTTLINGALTEEPGWRGFALPRLQMKYSALTASLILGLIWFSWHLPLLLTNDKGGPATSLAVLFVADGYVHSIHLAL
jgi:membrane protease YdiL (CAAX protease family)